MGLRISALINQKMVSFSTADAENIKQLSLYAHILESPDVIHGIAITKDYLIVMTEDPDLRNSTSAPLIKKNRSTNNINAYDWAGNHMWNIAEIVGEITASFWGGTVTTKELITDHVGVDPQKINENHDLFVCTATNDCLYIIDLTEKKLVQKVQTR